MNPNTERFLERELAFISTSRDELGRYFAQHYPAEAGFTPAFAQRYPAAAGRLEPEPEQTADPHAERLIQGFAFLAGRIHHKIDTEFPNLTEALLQVLYPHLLRPIPSTSVAQFAFDNSTPVSNRHIHIPAQSQLSSRPVGHPGIPCLWRTGYGVDLWPVQVTEATLQPAALFRGFSLPTRTVAVLQLQLQCPEGNSFQNLDLESLRFYLDGAGPLVAALYELLFNNATQVIFRDPDKPPGVGPLTFKPEECLSQVGFNLDEALLPFPCESFAGYRLLTELFCFPNKFHFFDLKKLGRVRQEGFGKRLQVLILLNRADEELIRSLNKQMFQLGCTPVINLFEKLADPFGLTHTHFEYKIVPDRRCPHGVEIYSVDAVTTFDPDQVKIKQYHPFYAFTFGQDRHTHKAFWYSRRKVSSHPGSKATDIYLVLVDRDFNPLLPADDSVNVYLTCMNRELPAQFLRAGDHLKLQNQGNTFSGSIRLLHSPTVPRRPLLRKGTFWKFISQSALNHVPLSDNTEGIDALKETLRLCTGGEAETGQKQQLAIIQQMIEGITAFESRKVIRPLRNGQRVASCRGMEFLLELDRQKYVGTGAFLFACVMERFLGLYASVNSFSQMILRTKQGKGYLKQWPPRATENQLI